MSKRIELGGIFSEGYGFVPKKLMKAKDISSNTKLILCYLLSYTGAGATAFPQQTEIAESLGISPRTIVNCVREAIKNGYINKHQEQRGRGIGKRNIYELIFMRGFGASAPVALANIARATITNASAKTDTMQVQPVHTNNNIASNSNNNNNIMRAKKPTCADVEEYAQSIGFTVNGAHFVDYYQARGMWGTPKGVKDWRACVRTWQRNENVRKQTKKYVAVGGVKDVGF
jgi:hypothetical protein